MAFNAALWKWFGNSVVRNPDGTPRVMYHGTYTSPSQFKRIDGMAGHFGTLKSAEDKIKHDIEDHGLRGKPAVMSVYLRICSPVEMTDVHFDEYMTMAEDLVERGVLTKRELPLPWEKRAVYGKKQERALKQLISVLESKGYDGILYINKIEDRGSVSFIPFHPSQIKSADNDGTWDADDPDIRSNPPATLLFSYGSNNPRQLAERLRHDIEGVAAYLPGYKRVFRGFSSRWDGGVASLEKRAGKTVFGYVAPVTESDLKVLDRYEGVASGYYVRKRLKVMVGNRAVGAIAYVSTFKEFNEPSREYLEACAKTVGAFWSGDGGKVTWKDFEVS